MYIKHIRIVKKQAWSIKNYIYVWDVSENFGEKAGGRRVVGNKAKNSGTSIPTPKKIQVRITRFALVGIVAPNRMQPG
jgi:hypothetical protein